MAQRKFSHSPISSKKDELAKQEEQLRRQMEQLERLIADAPKIAEAEQERMKRERQLRANVRRSPFDSPDILHDSRHSDDLFSERPHRPRRAQRRAARLRLLTMCLAVLAATAVVVFLGIQLIKHL
jgi:hypothetical protein